MFHLYLKCYSFGVTIAALLQVHRVHVWHDGRRAHRSPLQAHNNSFHCHDSRTAVQQAEKRLQAVLWGLCRRRESPHHIPGIRPNEVSWDVLTVENEAILIRFAQYSTFDRDFRMEDGKAEIPLNVTVQGDVLVVIYHARSTLGGRLQAKVCKHTHTHTRLHQTSNAPSLYKLSFHFQMASMKMFQIQFHTGFVPRNATTVKFAKFAYNFGAKYFWPDEVTVLKLIFPSLCFSCQVWFRCLRHTGEVPRPVPGEFEHWCRSQGPTQDQEPSLGVLPNQGPQPQDPLLLTWWTTRDTQQIWYEAKAFILICSCPYHSSSPFKLLIAALSTIFPVCRETWATSSTGIISVLWCWFPSAGSDPRRFQCKWTRVPWEHRW